MELPTWSSLQGLSGALFGTALWAIASSGIGREVVEYGTGGQPPRCQYHNIANSPLGNWPPPQRCPEGPSRRSILRLSKALCDDAGFVPVNVKYQ